MRPIHRLSVLVMVLFAVTSANARVARADAQLPLLRDNNLVYAHHHLNVTSIPDAKKFWVDTLGGTPVKAGPLEMVKFPNVIIVFTQRAPTGGSKGTTVRGSASQPLTRSISSPQRFGSMPSL